jgi:hypothetical protein
MRFRSARECDVVLLLAMIKGVYPVGHRNERRKASGIVTARVGKGVLVVRPSISPDGLFMRFQRVGWLEGWKNSAIF